MQLTECREVAAVQLTECREVAAVQLTKVQRGGCSAVN